MEARLFLNCIVLLMIPSIWLALLILRPNLQVVGKTTPKSFQMLLPQEAVHINCIQRQYFFYRNVQLYIFQY